MSLRLPASSSGLAAGLIVLALVAWPGEGVDAQEARPLPPALQQVQEMGSAPARAQEERVSPRGAFIRSLLIPGWGHAAVGAQGRGGFYFLAQSASLWMIFHSHGLRNGARELRRMEAAAAEARLRKEGVTDPLELERAVAADPRVEERQELVETRSQQIEDWTALSVFLLFLISADAFVSAHLMEFPEPLGVEVRPGSEPGRVEVGLSLPDRLLRLR